MRAISFLFDTWLRKKFAVDQKEHAQPTSVKSESSMKFGLKTQGQLVVAGLEIFIRRLKIEDSNYE